MRALFYLLSLQLLFHDTGDTMQTKAYGSWNTPISSDMVVEKSHAIDRVHVDKTSIYWTERLPEDNGRVALKKFHSKGIIEALPNTTNVRTKAHEYGGKCFTVQNGTIYFVSYKDQQLYMLSQDKLRQITDLPDYRFADFVVDQSGRYIYSVAETHTNGTVENSLICVDTKLSNVIQIASGYDFYMCPRISQDGKKITWVSWNQPNMPWDGSELWIADIEGSSLSNATLVAGGISEAIVDPLFSDDGHLYYISDKSGWWNFYRLENEQSKPICPKELEFGRPMWVFGDSTYCFVNVNGKQSIVASGTNKGVDCLYLIDVEKGKLSELSTPYTCINNLYTLEENEVVFTASSPKSPQTLIRLNLKTEEFSTIKTSQEIHVDESYISKPLPIAFPTEKGETSYGFYYPPHNPDVKAPSDEKAPVIIKCHGGPTANVYPNFSMQTQYFTSRGIGVFEINYGGSTGYGRAYRERLNKNWGIVDIQDCENGAKYLIKQGLADPHKIVIKGGSAGGYTTLAALTFTDTFSAGVSYYGVSDLIALAEDTHKFEARYLDHLIDVYPTRKDIYQKLSPINSVEKLSCPVLLLQGSEDKVVPKEQAEVMFEALKRKKIPTAYILFDGEGHGFRNSENIKKALESELYFYSKIFNFPVDKSLPKLKIENL